MKKTLIFIPIAIIVLTVSVLAFVSLNGYFEFGKKIKELNNKDKGETVATVNGTEIKETELEKSKALDEMSVAETEKQLEKGKDMLDKETYDKMKEKTKLKTKKELLDKKIQQVVIRQDIKKQNIKITESEISIKVEETMALLEESKTKSVDPDYYNNFVELLSGMGYTLEQYQKDLLPVAMKTMLESEKHFENFRKNLLKDKPDLKSSEIKEQYDKYIDKLVEKADIKILKDLK